MVNVAKRTPGAFVVLLLAIFLALPGLRAQSAEYECCNDAVFDGYVALEIDPEAPSLPPNLYNQPFFRITAKPNRRIGAQIPEYQHAVTPRSGAHLATFAPTPTGGSPTSYNLARASGTPGIMYYDPVNGCFEDPIMFGGPDDVLMAPFAPPAAHTPSPEAFHPIVFPSRKSGAQLWWHAPLSEVPALAPEYIEVKHFDGTIARFEKVTLGGQLQQISYAPSGAPSRVGQRWRLAWVQDPFGNNTVYEYENTNGRLERVIHPNGIEEVWNWAPAWAGPGTPWGANSSGLEISYHRSSGGTSVAVGAPLRMVFENTSTNQSLTHFAGDLIAYSGQPQNFVEKPTGTSAVYDLATDQRKHKVTLIEYARSGPDVGQIVRISHYWQGVGSLTPPASPSDLHTSDVYSYLGGKVQSHTNYLTGLTTTYSYNADLPTYPGTTPGTLSTTRETRQDGSFTVSEYDPVSRRVYRVYSGPGPAGKPRAGELPPGAGAIGEPDFAVVDRFYDATCVCQKPIRVETFFARASSGSSTTPVSATPEGVRVTHFEYDPLTKMVTRVRRPNPSTATGAPTYVEEVTTYHTEGNSLWSPRWVKTETFGEEGHAAYKRVEYAYPSPISRTPAWYGAMQGKVERTVKAVEHQTGLGASGSADVTESVVFNIPGNPGFLSGDSYSGPSSGSIRGQVRSVTNGDGVISRFLYDDLGRLNGSLEGASSATYVHDNWGRLTQVQTNATSSKAVTWAIEQEYNGRTTRQYTTAGPVADTRFHYDRWGNLAVKLTKNVSSSGGSPTKHGASSAARAWIRTEYLWDGALLDESRVDRRPLDEGDGAPFSATNPLFLITKHDYVINNTDGVLHRVTAPNGAKVEERYDGFGGLFRIKVAEDAASSPQTIEAVRYYNDVWGMVSRVVRGPISSATSYRMTTVTHNAGGAVVEAIEPSALPYTGYPGHLGGARHEFGVDFTGQATSHRIFDSAIGGASLKRSERAGYDKLGRLMWREVDVVGATSAPHRSVVGFQSGKLSQVAFTQATDSGRTDFTYDGLGRVGVVTTPIGTATYTYAAGTDWATSVAHAATGDSTANYLHAFDYDGLGRQTLVQQVDTASASNHLDGAYFYNSLGMVDRFVDPMGRVQKFLHDALGRRTEHARVGSGSNVIRNWVDYVDSGLASNRTHVSQYDGLGHVTRTYMDFAGRAFLIQNPGADVSVVSAPGAPHTEFYQYDLLSQITSKTDGDNGVTAFDYDGLGRLVRRQLTTLREPISNYNTIDVLVRDALGNITQAASGGSTNSGVTGVPNHAAPLLNKGATFDGLGRVTEELFAFAFTANAPKVTSSYNGAEGFRRQLRYDDQLATAGNPLEMSFTPDSAWRLDKIHWSRTGVGSNQELADYAWVGAMRHSRTVRYGGSTHVANGVESYTYDAFGRLSSIQDLTNLVGGGTPAGQAAQTNRFDYLYDAAGNLKEEKYAKAGGWLGDRFTYDEYHRLKKAYMGVSSALISPNPPTPSADPTGYSSANTKQLVEYDLDEAQNRLGVTETTSGGPVGFGYQLEDSGLSNRYLQAHDAKPEYDKRGNLIYDGQFYYRYDFLNRLQEVWRVLVEAAGAMQSAPESGDKYIIVDEVPALEESRQEVYEEVDNLLHRVPLEHKNPTFRSRLRSDIPGGVIRVPSATSTATSGGGMPQFFLPGKLELVALYGYDAFNRRVIRAVVNEDTYVTSYDGWREAVEHTLSLTTFQAKPTKQFVYGSRLDEMVAYRRYTGLGWETYYIQHGGQDTAAKLVSENGVVVEQYEYDAYGKATVYNSTWGLAGDGTKSAYGLPHMWKGIRRDPETGLLYMRNRFYSVVTGQFLSSDPIGVWADDGNMGNEYGYAWNRPGVIGDAFGLQGEPSSGGGGETKVYNLLLRNNDVYVQFSDGWRSVGDYFFDSCNNQVVGKYDAKNPKNNVTGVVDSNGTFKLVMSQRDLNAVKDRPAIAELPAEEVEEPESSTDGGWDWWDALDVAATVVTLFPIGGAAVGLAGKLAILAARKLAAKGFARTGAACLKAGYKMERYGWSTRKWGREARKQLGGKLPAGRDYHHWFFPRKWENSFLGNFVNGGWNLLNFPRGLNNWLDSGWRMYLYGGVRSVGVAVGYKFLGGYTWRDLVQLVKRHW